MSRLAFVECALNCFSLLVHFNTVIGQLLSCVIRFPSIIAKWLACQSMDNQILIYNVVNRFRQNRKKVFKGHMV